MQWTNWKPVLRPHRHRRRLAIIDPDPAVLCVSPRGLPAKLVADLRELVGLDLLELGLDVDAEQLRRVEPQNLVFDFVGQLWIVVFLDETVFDLEAPHALDLALRTAVPD